MKTSDTITNLAKAILTAQRKIEAVKKDAKNPFFKSYYADLPSIIDAVKGHLNDAGIVVLQPSAHRDGKNFIDTVLIHADSGEFMQSETEVIVAKGNDPQAFGAAQTYARRFGLQTMVFVAAEDDDGNKAADRPVQTASLTAGTTISAPMPNRKQSSFRKDTPTTTASTAAAASSNGEDQWM